MYHDRKSLAASIELDLKIQHVPDKIGYVGPEGVRIMLYTLHEGVRN